jgi:prepilin-type N-terminal cleavage/methylation domain-containing protein
MNLKKNEAGFTLIEIAVAVAILGIALTTLVGLQTRMLDIYFNERNRFDASLYGQYLMVALETKSTPPSVSTREGDLRDALEKAGFFDNDGFDEPLTLRGAWQYREEVSSVDLPLISDAMRRVDLTISWGDLENEDESYSLVHFIPVDIQSNRQSPFSGGFAPTP